MGRFEQRPAASEPSFNDEVRAELKILAERYKQLSGKSEVSPSELTVLGVQAREKVKNRREAAAKPVVQKVEQQILEDYTKARKGSWADNHAIPVGKNDRDTAELANQIEEDNRRNKLQKGESADEVAARFIEELNKDPKNKKG